MRQPLSLKIGPSGVRGVIGESLTPQLVTSFAAAFGTYCGAGPILIGTDTRPSAEMVKQAAIAGLLSVGCTPVDTGIVPLPALMLHVREAGAFGGISVSGSHGSLEWNALRFIDAEGLALRANQSAELTDLYHQGVYPRVRAADMSEVRADTTSVSRHLRAVTQMVDVELIRSARFKVAVDPRGGAASVAVTGAARRPRVRRGRHQRRRGHAVPPEPGAGRDDPGRTRRPRAHARARTSASPRTRTRDRLAIVDEHGTPLGTDATVVLVVQRWLERSAGPVVASVSTSRMVDDVAAGFGCPVYRSRVGEAHVIEAMKLRGAEVGGEGDGGAIVLQVNPCRDSFAAMALVLEAMAVSGRSAAELMAQVPRYAMVRERLLCSARDIAPSLRVIKDLFRGEQFDLTDGVKVTWPDRWLLARPSATEPVIRLAAEAPAESEARALVNRVLEVLSPGA